MFRCAEAGMRNLVVRPSQPTSPSRVVAKILELITGKDDLERVACRGDIRQLSTYLKTRPVFIPRRPSRSLDADNFTADDLLQLVEEEAELLGSDSFEPWILEVEGKKRLPAFSSEKQMDAFSASVSKKTNRVFSLGCIEILLSEITSKFEVDYVDLNRYSKRSWEIGIGVLRPSAEDSAG
jgi:hypothetical protein